MSTKSILQKTHVSNYTENIILYTNHSSECEYLKAKIESQIDLLGLQLHIIEVNQLSQITKKELMHLPTVQFRGEVLHQGGDDIVSYTLRSLKRIMKLVKEPHYNKVIIPTDFSSSAIDASAFGTRLAALLSADIQLLHVDRVEYTEGLSYENVLEINRNKKEALLDKQMTTSRKLWPNHHKSNNKITTKLRTGFVAEQILEESMQNGKSLIVMGTTGSSSRIKQFMGSVSTSVAAKSIVPVLLIPPKPSPNDIKNILYCVKEGDLDLAVLDQLVPILKGTGAYLHIINIDRRGQYDPSALIGVLGQNYPKEKLKFIQLKTVASPSNLTAYALDNDMDMIVLNTKPRTRIQKLFHNSYTYELALDTHIPLLILRK